MVILTQLLILFLVLILAFKVSHPKKRVISFDPNQFISNEPVIHNLPKGAIKNSHWFTHTFMRSRRKGKQKALTQRT